MAKDFETIDREQNQMKQGSHSRKEIAAALAQLEKIAEKLPPVDVVAIVREGRDVISNRSSDACARFQSSSSSRQR
jgi:hypothetical protein